MAHGGVCGVIVDQALVEVAMLKRGLGVEEASGLSVYYVYYGEFGVYPSVNGWLLTLGG